MQAISDVRFPDDIAYGSTGGPVFSTTITTNAGGYEQRGSNWAHPRAVYNVAHGVKNAAQLDTLIAFFRARKGRAQGFRFKDWSDYRLIGEIIATADGTTSEFPLTKTYSSGAEATIRRLTRPHVETISVFVDGVLQGSGISIDATTGMISFTAAPQAGAIITVDGEFDVPVRFETDQLAARLDDYGVYSWGEIPLVEIREGQS